MHTEFTRFQNVGSYVDLSKENVSMWERKEERERKS